MAKDDGSNAKALTRQRKTHRKSRLGCANCKLRGVKVRYFPHVMSKPKLQSS